MKKLILILPLLVLLASFVSAIAPDDEDILGYWIMDETSGHLVDSKTNSKPKINMNPVGDPTYRQEPNTDLSDYSIDFDGTGDYFVNDSTEVKGWFGAGLDAEGFTVGASFNTADANGGIISWFPAGYSGFHMFYYETDNIVWCYSSDSDRAATTVTAGLNYTVFCTYNTTNNNLSIYKKEGSSGTPVYDNSVINNYVGTTTTPLYIGDDPTLPTFDGTISNVILINRTLNTVDVLELMSNGLVVVVDLTPPTLSDAICTSCTTGTNQTTDSTPTINVTCVDDEGACALVRISNTSTYTFDTATSARNCTASVGDDWVCTLPSSDELTSNGQSQSLYFWGLDNLGNNHTIWNTSIDITWQDPCIYDGTGNWSVYSYCEYTDTNINVGKDLIIKDVATMNCTTSHCNLNFTSSNQWIVFDYIESLYYKLVGNWTINQP